jgi:hypothetical protein
MERKALSRWGGPWPLHAARRSFLFFHGLEELNGGGLSDDGVVVVWGRKGGDD